MKKKLEKIYKNCVKIYDSNNETISPYLLNRVHNKILTIWEEQIILGKKLNWFKNLSLKNEEKLSRWLLEVSRTLENISEGLGDVSDFLIDLSLQLDESHSISPDKNVQEGAQLMMCKKVDGGIRYLQPTLGGILVDYPGMDLAIIDKNLKATKKIFLFEGLFIDRLFQKFSHDEALIYDDSNKMLVHISLSDGSFRIIRLPTLPFLTLFYWWVDNEVILNDTKGKFYALDLETDTLKRVSTTYKKSHYYMFYKLCKKGKEYDNITNVEPQAYTFTYLDRYNKKAGVINLVSDTEEQITFSEEEVFNVFYDGTATFYLIGSYSIEFKSKKRRGIIRARPGFEFRGAILMSGLPLRLLVLSQTIGSFFPETALSIYQLV